MGNTTPKGLKIKAELDERHCPTRIKLTNAQLTAVPITRDEFHTGWNYTRHHTRPAKFRAAPWNTMAVTRDKPDGVETKP
jgi:hypothetical protein